MSSIILGGKEATLDDGTFQWWVPTENPFGQGCCDCGLFHKIKYRIFNEEGKEINGHIELQFYREEEITKELRTKMREKQL